ncbi:site-specific integrase [Streptomyces sp. NPDC003863]
MAGHIQDRWFKVEQGADGKTRRVRTDHYGTGMRYRARYVGPDGTEKSKSFPDRQKRLAEQWLTSIETDMARGEYIDPKVGRTTFQQYAERWVAAQTTDVSTRTGAESRIRLHAYPYIGSRPLGSFQPEHIREWLRKLEDAGLAASTRRTIYANVSAVFTAAVDDRLIARNPFRAASVKAPAQASKRVRPWSVEQVFAVRRALPAHYRAMVDVGGGCGLRQGEIFGLPFDEVGFLTGWLHVGYQVKLIGGRAVFAPPKRGKVRDVPLPAHVSRVPAAHMEAFPPEDGMHALRHFYASVLLDAGENIKALSGYLGHADPGFTLRTYTHLMPSSESRTRKAVDDVYRARGEAPDGPQTAQAA